MLGAVLAFLVSGSRLQERFLKVRSLLDIGIEELISVLFFLGRILADEDGLQAELVKSLESETAASFWLLTMRSVSSSLRRSGIRVDKGLGSLEVVICSSTVRIC